MENGLAGPDEEVLVLALTPADAVVQAPVWLQQGIAAITFDHGMSGYFAPLGQPACDPVARGRPARSDTPLGEPRQR